MPKLEGDFMGHFCNSRASVMLEIKRERFYFYFFLFLEGDRPLSLPGLGGDFYSTGGNPAASALCVTADHVTSF